MTDNEQKELDFELPTYREYIYKVCTKVDLDNKEEVIALLQYLADEAIMNNDFLLRYDKKIKEVLSASEYEKWSKEVAKSMFAASVDRMFAGDFKDFCIEHFEDITK